MTHRQRTRPAGAAEPSAQLAFDLAPNGPNAPNGSRDSGLGCPRPASPESRVPSPDPHAFHAKLRALGLTGIDHVRLTRNRTVMVSFSGGELRVHEGYLDASTDVLRAVVRFVCGRTRAERRKAREVILAYQIARPAAASRRREHARPEDSSVVAQLERFHAHYNRLYFGGRLRTLPIRLSGRMRTRLGHYTAASPTGEAAEIVIGRDHIRRHGWEEALHTLLHEMVHQWQDESGHAIDHGATFRQKARDVGITPSARRHVTPRRQRATPQAAPTAHTIGLRAAREE